MIGVMAGVLAFAFVMINLWMWNIVPIEVMREFDSDKNHVYMIVGISIASMFGGGMLFKTIFRNR